MQQYLPTELARNIGALLWQLLWYLTTNCVLGYTLLRSLIVALCRYANKVMAYPNERIGHQM